tara:strand:- start:43 stop:441 length:399 start_codon:yes stop_codon:yes gene_type:complete
MVPSLNHIAIKTNGVDRLSKFYSEVLGLTFVKQHRDDKGLRSIWLRLGSGLLMLERSEHGGSRSQEANFKEDPTGIHLIALSVEKSKKEDWRARLEQNKVSIEFESEYTIYFFDPDGNRIGLSSFDPSTITN